MTRASHIFAKSPQVTVHDECFFCYICERDGLYSDKCIGLQHILYLGDRFGARAFLVDILYFIHKIYNYLQ